MSETHNPDQERPRPGGSSRDAQRTDEQRSKPALEPPAEEIGGPRGPEPTRYGDWERNGRCTDF